MLVKQLFYLFFFSLSTWLLSSQTAYGLCVPQTVYDDWITVPECQSLCEGYYCELSPPYPGQSAEFLAQQPISASSESGIYPQIGPTQLKGKVHLIQGNRQLFADKLELYRDSKNTQLETAIASGHVRIIEPGLRIDGPLATVNKTEDIQTMQNAHFRFYPRHAHGSSEQITVCGKTHMELQNASYSTCNPYQNTWYLASSKVTLNKITGRGQARHAKLYLKNTPIFYFPYIDFPIDSRRETGFLFPSGGFTNNSGFEFSTPFYWNLAPNYDALLTPTYYSKRGLEARGLFRYLFPNSDGDLEASILPHDWTYKAFQKEHLYNHPGLSANDPKVLALKGNCTRESLRFRHLTRFNQHWESRVIYQWVKDDNYFMDLGNSLNAASTTQQLQQADLLYQDCDWNNVLRFQQYQTLHPYNGPVTTPIYKRLPQFALTKTDIELPYGWMANLSGDFTHFDHIQKNYFVTGNRFQTRPSLYLPLTAPGWFFTPRLQWDLLCESLQNNYYDFDARNPQNPNNLSCNQNTSNAQTIAHPKRNIPLVDLDTGLIFERNLHFAQCNYIQTLEPRLYYLYVPYRNQNELPVFDSSFIPFDFNQLYRDNRFSGFDRIGDTNQVTLGLTQRFLPVQTGIERLNITLGQIFYLSDRKVYIYKPENLLQNAHHSALVGRMSYRLKNDWSLYTELEWDPDQKRADKRSISLQYSPDPLDVLNLRYLFIRDNINIINPNTCKPERLDQTDVSYAWRLTEQWRLLGRWHYDIVRHKTNDLLLGLEQQGCCTAFRFAVVRFLPPNNPLQPNSQKPKLRFQLQFVFKGLTNVGTKIQPMLSEKIPGYRWRGDAF